MGIRPTIHLNKLDSVKSFHIKHNPKSMKKEKSLLVEKDNLVDEYEAFGHSITGLIKNDGKPVAVNLEARVDEES